jgi:hypothetical protein
MDKDQQIKELQQLISNATGDNLKYLFKRLQTSFDDKSEKKEDKPKKKKVAKPT